MSKIEKLYDRIKNNPKNVRFEEIKHLLITYGFTYRQPRSGSSHYVFTKKECPYPVTISHQRPVNKHFINEAIKAIEDYGDLLLETEN